LAECYANKGFAQLLKQKLSKKLKKKVVLKHSYTYSRDEVLKKATPKSLKNWCQTSSSPFPSVVVVLIDREEGMSSTYIDGTFHERLPVKLEQYCISMHIRRESKYVMLGIVFNPRIEEALEAIIGRKLNREIRRKIKDKNGVLLGKRLLSRSENLDEILRKLTDAVIRYGKL